MDVGLPFNDPRTAERISMTIRALSSVGSLVSLQAGYIAGPVAHGALMTAARELKINVDIPNNGDGSYDIEHNARVGSTLLASALNLAHYCFASEVQDDGSVRIVHRYALPGVTIATLFRELERNKIELGDSEREAIAVITYCALAMERARADNPDMRPARKDDELRPATLNTALGLVVRGVADAPAEPAEAAHSATAIQRAECVSRILHLGLSKITDASFLGAAQDAMAQAFEVNDAEVDRYTGWHDAIEARLAELDKNRAKMPAAAQSHAKPARSSGWLTKLLDGRSPPAGS